MTTYDVRVGGKSDIGKVRKENQDALLISQPDDEDVLEHKGVLVVLADGMGGLEDGREASQLAVDTIKRFYYSSKRDPRTGLEKAVQQANTAIYMKSTQGPESRQMGSTVTAFAVTGDQAVVAQVGDSRAYRIRDGEIRQITRDHSLVRELLDRGEIDRDSAQYAFHRNILTRGLGLREEVVVDTYELIGLHPGDTFLLSSDGLHELVSEAELCASVDRTDVNLDEACQSLVDLACERGAPDNSTVALVQVNLIEH